MADEVLESLVTEFLLRKENGEEGVLDHLCERHPALATELRRRISRLGEGQKALERIALSGRATGVPPRILGRFEILGELGHGGMGVVYRALDPHMNREVALKVLSSTRIEEPAMVERFGREVRIVARLRHPCIVPIYEVGESNGLQYFTMEYVRGPTLAGLVSSLKLTGKRPGELDGSNLQRILDDQDESDSGRKGDGRLASGDSGPSIAGRGYVDFVARTMLDLAGALEVVHAAEVLHRDIKPSNVMVFDGRAMLLDFGLARVEKELHLTTTGTFVGTPYYVSPEQVRDARQVDHRSDIYSLGATLYELLTLEPPFQGESTQEILRNIATREPLPVRRHNPAVPRDLETICLTMLEKDPDRRYGSATLLAEDLHRFLEYRPILARPIGPASRVFRWVRRNPAQSTAGILAFVLLVVGPTGFGLYHRAVGRQLLIEREEANEQRMLAADRARDALLQAEEARRKSELAERSFGKAKEAVDTLLQRVAGETLLEVPRMEELRRDLLEKALHFYEGFITERSDDPQVRFDAARMKQELADLLTLLGRRGDAEARYREAVRELQELEPVAADRVAWRQATAQAFAALGSFLRYEMRVEEALSWLDRAESVLASGDQGVASQEPLSVRMMAELAADRGTCLMLLRRADEALSELLRGRELVETQLKSGKPEAVRSCLVRIDGSLGMLEGMRNRYADALFYYRSALGCQEELLVAEGSSPQKRAEAERLRVRVGAAELIQSGPESAEPYLETAVERLQRLVDDFPRALELRVSLGSALNELAASRLFARDLTDVEELLDRSRDELDVVARGMTGLVPLHRWELAQTLRLRGSMLILLGRSGEADECLRLAATVADVYPGMDDRSSGVWLGRMIRDRGIALHEEGRLSEAEALFRQTLEIAEALARGGSARERSFLADALCSLASHVIQSGRSETAIPLARRALALMMELAGEGWIGNEYPSDAARILAWALKNAGQDIEEGVAAIDAAIDVVRSSPRVETVSYRYSLAFALQTRSNGLKALGRIQEAEASLRETLPIIERLAIESPGVPEYRSRCGAILNDLAFLLWERCGRFEEALELYVRAEAQQREAIRLSPGNRRYSMFLEFHLRGRANCHIGLGKPAEASAIIEGLETRQRFGTQAQDLALLWLGCRSAVEKDATLSSEERGARGEEYLDRALSVLEREASAGRLDRKALQGMDALAALRNQPRFEALLDTSR